MGLVPFFEPPQIVQLEEPPRRDKVTDGQGDPCDGRAEHQEFLLGLRPPDSDQREGAVTEQAGELLAFPLPIQITERRVSKEDLRQREDLLTKNRERQGDLLVSALNHRRQIKGWRSAPLDQLRQFLIRDVQDGRGEVSCGKFLLLIEHLVVPKVEGHVDKAVVLLYPQRHFSVLLSYILFATVLRYSHFTKSQRIIKWKDKSHGGTVAPVLIFLIGGF